MECGLSPHDMSRTSDELYRRMSEPSFGSDDAYWSSLPAHLRNFIRNALPLAGNLAVQGNGSGVLPGGVTGAGGQRSMYAMAQNIVSTAGGALRSSGGSTMPLSTLSPSTPCALLQPQRNDLQLEDSLVRRSSAKAGLQSNSKISPDTIHESNKTATSHEGTTNKENSSAIPSHGGVSKLPPRSPDGSHRGIHQQPAAGRHLQGVTAPPSSRAAGKQPMQPVNPQSPSKTPTIQPAVTPSNRSARAAGKAPVSSATGPCHQGVPTTASSAAVQNKPGIASNVKAKPGPSTPAPVRVWQTSTAEEREEIKHFWRGLSSDGRRRLVRTEKDAVLKRMKDYQRHACNCTICGRKRVTIESELEILYEAYEKELELYESRHGRNGSLVNVETREAVNPGPFPGSVEVDSAGNVLHPDYLAPLSYHDARTNDRTVGDSDEDYDDDDDEYDEEDEDELEEEDDLRSNEAEPAEDDFDAYDHQTSRNVHKSPAGSRGKMLDSHPTQQNHVTEAEAHDFVSFQGELSSIKGVLTVADDLLRNDGQRFLEMMEHLAERRFARGGVAPIASVDTTALTHGADDQDSGDDLVDRTTETHKLEEGRRMFQIFAARSFEQRVLQAYREQLAQQKQLQFLKELEDEETAAEAREARKAKEAQKKKDKRRQQKQAKDDEKAKRDALLAEEAEMARVKQATAEKEANRRREDERVRREAEKRAKLEDQLRKEEERRKRQEREKEAEKAKKQRERDERSKSNRSIAGEVVSMNGENQRLSNNGSLVTSRKQSTPQALLVPISDTGRLLERGRSSKPANEDIPQPKSDASYRPSSRPSAGEAQHENSATASASQTRHAADKESRYTAEDVASSGIANSRLAVTTRPNELAVDTSPAVYDTQQWDAPLAAKAAASRTQEGSTIATIPSTATVTPSIPIEGSALSGVVGSAVSSTAYSLGATGTNTRGGAYVAGVTSHGQMAENAYPVMISPGIPAPIRQGVHHSGTMLAAPVDALPVTRLQDPIGPIQPIGRPRPCGPPFPLEQPADHVGKPFSTRKASVSHDQVLGSAALSSGDDEVIIPAPRRVSHGHNALGSKWNAGSQLSSPHWGAAFAAAPAPIWGRSELSPGAVHTWPAAGNSGTYIGHRYDGPIGLAESFPARAQQQQQGTSRPAPTQFIDITRRGNRDER